MLIDASRISSPSVPCSERLKANPGCQAPRPLLCGVHGLDPRREPPALPVPVEEPRVPSPWVWQCLGVSLMESPGFVLARLWVTSTSAWGSLRRPREGPARWVQGCPGGTEGRAERCSVPGSAGQWGKPGSSLGEEGCRWLRRREELGHLSQGLRAQPSTGPVTRGSPSDPREGLCGDSGHQVLS